MSAKKRVLFVCTGNTCRSPLAEGILRAKLGDRSDFEVSSAGVAAYPGQPVNPETAAILERRGISLDGFVSRPVDEKMLEQSTHVFAMTRSHLRTLEEMFPALVERFFLVTEFADIPGHGVGCDVPDPLGMGKKAYAEVEEVLDVAIPGIIAFIDQTFQVD